MRSLNFKFGKVCAFFFLFADRCRATLHGKRSGKFRRLYYCSIWHEERRVREREKLPVHAWKRGKQGIFFLTHRYGNINGWYLGQKCCHYSCTYHVRTKNVAAGCWEGKISQEGGGSVFYYSRKTDITVVTDSVCRTIMHFFLPTTSSSSSCRRRD